MSNRIPTNNFGTSLHTNGGGLSKSVADQRYINVSGDKMDNDLDMNGFKISNVDYPEHPSQVANKSYVDQAYNLLAKQAYVATELARVQQLIDSK